MDAREHGGGAADGAGPRPLRSRPAPRQECRLRPDAGRPLTSTSPVATAIATTSTVTSTSFASSTVLQCFSGLAILSLLWVVIGFSLCFAPTDLGLVGGLDYLALDNVGWATSLPNAPTIPGVLFASFQNKFATITPLLCTGAFAERFKFEAYMLFLVLWSFLVYYPLCHWVWGGGCTRRPRLDSWTSSAAPKLLLRRASAQGSRLSTECSTLRGAS